MRATRSCTLLTSVLVIALIQGCAHYVVTQNLTVPLGTGQSCLIGDITESLPADVDDEDKPPMSDLDEFRSFLKEALEKKNICLSSSETTGKPDCEITGNILEYKRGSGAVRVLIGFGLGNAKITIEMKLRNIATGEIAFAGNFKQSVSSGYESGLEMYRRVAKDFAKELSNQQKKLIGSL